MLPVPPKIWSTLDRFNLLRNGCHGAQVQCRGRSTGRLSEGRREDSIRSVREHDNFVGKSLWGYIGESLDR